MKKQLKTQSSKVGLPPGSLIHLGKKKMDHTRISCMRYSENEFNELEDCSLNDVEAELALKGNKWINIDGIHDAAVIEKVGKLFKLHPLLLEGILNTFLRPKYEDFDEFLYLNLKMIGIGKDRRSIVVEQVGFILGENYILSFQEQPGDLFDFLRQRLRENKAFARSKSIDYLYYRFVDTIVDNYFLVTEHLSEINEELEENVLQNPGPEILKEIQWSKKELIRIRKVVVPLREAINSLYRDKHSLLSESTIPYLRNVYEHITQVMEWSETQRDMVGSIMDLYLSEMSNKMNQVMKTLTIIATIFIPLTFLAGIYGMNFEFIPELHWRYGYLFFWVAITCLVFVMILYFKRKKWF